MEEIFLAYWDYFVGFRDPHLPSALKKATFEKVWNAEPEILKETCMAKFRNFSCVNYWLVEKCLFIIEISKARMFHVYCAILFEST